MIYTHGVTHAYGVVTQAIALKVITLKATRIRELEKI